jgi:uncharacterized membrane protein YedE/YeeE
MKNAVAFACGALFAFGLGLAGMTQPQRVLGFLDVAGSWDPTLAVVMGSALLVTALAFPRILAAERAALGGRFALPEQRAIDAPLLGGSVLFGIGWGLAGYCPGPALVSLVTTSPQIFVFVIALAVGLGFGQWLLDLPWRDAPLDQGVIDVPPF